MSAVLSATKETTGRGPKEALNMTATTMNTPAMMNAAAANWKDYAPYTPQEIVAHLQGNLDIGLRWNGLFRCFEVKFPSGEDAGRWLPASPLPRWQNDDVHRRLREKLAASPRRRTLGTWRGYDAMLRRVRLCRELEHRPLIESPPVMEVDCATGSDRLAAHIAAFRKAYRTTLPNLPPLLTVPHGGPLMPSKWERYQEHVFDVRALDGMSPADLGRLWSKSCQRGERVVVMVGTPTERQAGSGYLSVADELPDPEAAWQDAQRHLDRDRKQGITGAGRLDANGAHPER